MAHPKFDNEIKVSAFKEDGTLIGKYDSINKAHNRLLISNRRGGAGTKLLNSKKSENKILYSRMLKENVYLKETI